MPAPRSRRSVRSSLLPSPLGLLLSVVLLSIQIVFVLGGFGTFNTDAGNPSPTANNANDGDNSKGEETPKVVQEDVAVALHPSSMSMSYFAHYMDLDVTDGVIDLSHLVISTDEDMAQVPVSEVC